MTVRNIFNAFIRKKTFNNIDVTKSSLKRCLNTLDLTGLGIGATLGAGVYVVTGQVARLTAGPSVIVSFFVAAVASFLAGICYAEFGARVPRSGSAYIYSYVVVGELMAFIIGWNLILEFAIGSACIAKACSDYLNELTGGEMHQLLKQHLSMNLPGFSSFVDLFAFSIPILLTIILCLGVKESTRLNNIFTVVNISVVLYAVVCGMWSADINNWNLSPPTNYTNESALIDKLAMGTGHFFPFGVTGMLSGAATCFYAFVGFDAITTTGEEVINPQKSIPLAIVGCLFVCFLAYALISAVITLMCPYYLINPNAPLPFVFERIGWNVSRYIVGYGAVFGLSASLIGAMFSLPRIVYSMANDGLIFKFLSYVSPRFQTPLYATIVSGILSAIMSSIFDLKSLVEMMSIGTLLAYTLVAFSVILLRKTQNVIEDTSKKSDDFTYKTFYQDDSIKHIETYEKPVDNQLSLWSYLSIIMSRSKHQTDVTDNISRSLSFILVALIVVLNVILVAAPITDLVVIISLCVCCILIGCTCTLLTMLPECPSIISIKLPVVAWLAGFSIFINIYLMMKLPILTWYRFFIWMTLGFIMYFCYGVWQSEERIKKTINQAADRQCLLSE